MRLNYGEVWAGAAHIGACEACVGEEHVESMRRYVVERQRRRVERANEEE